MNLRRCESPGDIARIAALSADHAPTAIIGCPHTFDIRIPALVDDSPHKPVALVVDTSIGTHRLVR